MKKVLVIKKDKYIYVDYKDDIYMLKMIFLNSCFNIEIGDIIYLDDTLFDEITSNLIYFDLLKNNDCSLDDKDVILVIHDAEKLYLKRLYG